MSKPMKITIGRFEAATSVVPVVFEQDGKAHSRSVNAVFFEDGRCDREATKARVADVGAGVANKFALGLLGDESVGG